MRKLIPPQDVNASLLFTSYMEVREECERIQKLLKGTHEPELPDFLVEQLPNIQLCLGAPLRKMRTLQQQMDNIFEKEQIPDPVKPRSQIYYHKKYTKDELDEAWIKLYELKTVVLPALSSELLAVIGGITLKKFELDILPLEQGESEVGRISFSKIAERLCQDLFERSDSFKQPKMLIVGEEFLSNPYPEIIRLRFPGCDIWNLPFTAHEYGYQAARALENEIFSEMLRNVEAALQINTKTFSVTDCDECYLDDARDQFKKFREISSEDSRSDHLEKNKMSINGIRKRQTAFLCRLYADAFAVFFTGPAYIYTLLCLRFIPDENLDEPSDSLPPFKVRLMFALEILSWMNSIWEEQSHDTDKKGLFDRVLAISLVGEPASIPALWWNTLCGLRLVANDKQIGEEFQNLAKQYKPWLDRIKHSLIKDFPSALDYVYSDWNLAGPLAEALTGNSSISESDAEIKTTSNGGGNKVPANYSNWAVINAAWLARCDKPDQVETISRNALRLLAKEDRQSSQPRADSIQSPRPSSAVAKPSVEIDMTIIRRTLGKDINLMGRFLKMEKSQNFQPDPDILVYLAENNGLAYEEFAKLVAQSSQKGDSGGDEYGS